MINDLHNFYEGIMCIIIPIIMGEMIKYVQTVEID